MKQAKIYRIEVDAVACPYCEYEIIDPDVYGALSIEIENNSIFQCTGCGKKFKIIG